MASCAWPSKAMSPPLLETVNLGRMDLAGQISLLTPTNFSLPTGSKLAITGASGSGKSVFLRLLAWLDPPTTGQIRWHNNPISADMITRYRTSVCYVSQKPALIDGTVEDNLRFPFALKSHRHRKYNAETIRQLLDFAGKNLSFINKLTADLSGGEAQIVALVRALQLTPQVMLFDEPTSALDPQSATAIEGLIGTWFVAGQGERAYIWVSHDHVQVERMCTHRLRMHQGTLERSSDT